MAMGLGSLMGGGLSQSSSTRGGVSEGGSQQTGGTTIDVSSGGATDAGELLQIAQMPPANGGQGMNVKQTSFSQPFSSSGWRSGRSSGSGVSTTTLAMIGGFGLITVLLLRR